MKSKLMVRGTMAGVFVILLSLVLIISALPVQAIPLPGHHFYGNVIGAGPGAVISARINGTEYTTSTVDAENRYGYSPKLVVPSDDVQTRRVREGGRTGDTVEFYIMDKLAGQATFAVWGLTQLDLSLQDDPVLSVTSGGNGSTDPSGTATYPYNTVVNIAATADPGCELDYWEVNGVDSGDVNPLSITMDGDYTVTAYFAEVGYQLSVTSVGNGSTDPSGTITCDYGLVVNITATADSGCELDYWVVNGVDSGDVNPLSITMDGNYTVTANFAEITSEGSGGGDDNSNMLPPLGGSLVAFVFIPGSQADVAEALAGINAYFNGSLQTYFLYFPGESEGSGYWQEIP